jgi:hypothetical protein
VEDLETSPADDFPFAQPRGRHHGPVGGGNQMPGIEDHRWMGDPLKDAFPLAAGTEQILMHEMAFSFPHLKIPDAPTQRFNFPLQLSAHARSFVHGPSIPKPVPLPPFERMTGTVHVPEEHTKT